MAADVPAADGVEGKGWVAMILSVCGDESSDETRQRVFAVGGVIGSEETWCELEAKWVARTGGVPFHANKCDSDQGDYAKTTHADNKALYRELTILLAESGLGGWGFAIDLSAQRKVFPDAPDIAYYKCFLEVVQAMKNCAATNGATARFTFDMRRESEYNTGLLYNMAMTDWKEHMFSSIAFECSRDNTGVQVADLFTRETMKALDNIVGPVKRPTRKSWLALHDTGRFHIDVVADAWFESLKGQMPMLEEQTGMSSAGYADWLKTNNLQDSTTNLFRYMDWSDITKER
ncbi:MAG: DUF3800 domain-containing protein [Pseudomonadota bacterium]|nr:DUF3800 domain-containing protein [Pseudomonadota bacterium]